MLIIEKRQELQDHLNKPRKADKSIGLVPTMGALHKGHMALVERCLKDCEITVVTVFVNPKQFNDPIDYQSYPKTLDEDQEMLRKAGVDIMFIPSYQEMYPSTEINLTISFGRLQSVLEGRFRSGHFEGVGLIIAKLFNAVRPAKAFFGEKDYQQLAIIRELNNALTFNVDIIGVPIVREDNGLAMSSRNERLNSEHRQQAAILYRSLIASNDKLSVGEDVRSIKSYIGALFDQEKEIVLEYFEIADQETLQPTEFLEKNKKYRALIAAIVSGVRLIDNIEVGEGKGEE